MFGTFEVKKLKGNLTSVKKMVFFFVMGKNGLRNYRICFFIVKEDRVDRVD